MRWMNSQFAFIGSYETGKMIMVPATPKPITLELGEEVVFEYVDIGKRYMPHAKTYIRCVRQRLNAL